MKIQANFEKYCSKGKKTVIQYEKRPKYGGMDYEQS